jgi:hypothetical protein
MARPLHDAEDPRRAFLLQALAAGLLAAGGISRAAAQILGKQPHRLPPRASRRAIASRPARARS